MSPGDAKAWLAKLGDKFLGDGVCESVKASDLLEVIDGMAEGLAMQQSRIRQLEHEVCRLIPDDRK